MQDPFDLCLEFVQTNTPSTECLPYVRVVPPAVTD